MNLQLESPRKELTLLSPRPSRRATGSYPTGTAFTMMQPAPAKLNLFLEVLGRRSDGYHELSTCMLALDLHDSLSFAPARTLHLTCDEPSLGTGPDNLVLQAARLLQRHTGCTAGAAIHLTKRIPLAAGLGGGSSDAAATLRGLMELWGLKLPVDEQMALAAELGSDVPFFMGSSAAWCTGRGEILEPIVPVPDLAFVLICPAGGLSTAEVFRRVRVPAVPRSGEPLRAALAASDPAAVGKAMFNRLEEAAWPLCPVLEGIRQRVAEIASSQPILGHQMSGSGSTYFVVCHSLVDAQRVAAMLRSSGEGQRGQDDPWQSLLVVRSRRPRG